MRLELLEESAVLSVILVLITWLWVSVIIKLALVVQAGVAIHVFGVLLRLLTRVLFSLILNIGCEEQTLIPNWIFYLGACLWWTLPIIDALATLFLLMYRASQIASWIFGVEVITIMIKHPRSIALKLLFKGYLLWLAVNLIRLNSSWVLRIIHSGLLILKSHVRLLLISLALLNVHVVGEYHSPMVVSWWKLSVNLFWVLRDTSFNGLPLFIVQDGNALEHLPAVDASIYPFGIFIGVYPRPIDLRVWKLLLITIVQTGQSLISYLELLWVLFILLLSPLVAADALVDSLAWQLRILLRENRFLRLNIVRVHLIVLCNIQALIFLLVHLGMTLHLAYVDQRLKALVISSFGSLVVELGLPWDNRSVFLIGLKALFVLILLELLLGRAA